MLKYRHIISATLFCLLVKWSYSQQDPMYSLYLHDKALINPGYVGSSNWIVGTIKYRTQFMGIPGAPITQTFNLHAPIQKKHIGLGLKVINDKIAVINSTIATGVFSYHLGLAGGKLSLGVEGGLANQRINFPDLIKKDAIDNTLNDAAQAKTVADASFGMYYKKKNFSFGISAVHLPNSKFKFGADNSAPYAHLYSHYYMFSAYGLDLSDKIYLEPSVLLKSTSAVPLQMDINAVLNYNERISFGVSYRTGDAVCGIFKINITEQLRVAYSYDHTISNLSAFTGGAHEIMLSYGIKLLPPAAEKEVHPRFYF